MPPKSATLLLVFVLAVSSRAADPSDADEKLLRSHKVGTDAASLLDFFRKRTLRDADRETLAALVRKLGDDSFAVRERASDDLVTAGPLARALLRAATRDPDAEIARRAADCLVRLEQVTEPPFVAAAARLLARHKDPAAAETLLNFLPFAESPSLADEVTAALALVAVRDGRSDEALLKALADRSPAKRAAAAEALIRAAAANARSLVRSLLKDVEPTVRQRVALALVEAKDKEAVPVLIALLAEAPREQTYAAEDVLFRLAGDKAPPSPSGNDDAARRKYRAAWEAWWKDNGADLDLAKIDLAGRLLGYTLVAVYNGANNGKVFEVDAAGKVRWKIEGLRYPIDAQMLGGNRVLITEYTGREVTERNLEGKVLWRKTAAAGKLLLSARRLPNGNTFLVARNGLTEVDRDDKEVLNLNRPNDVAAATRLRDGRIALLTNRGQFVLLDEKGKELKSFNAGSPVLAIGSGFEVLPNGHVVVPFYTANKVVEYDADGREVLSLTSQRPTSVARLSNGNFLITSRYERNVVELDRTGKQVWSFTAAEGFPLRATRR
jgi:hypothetical protein